MVAAGAGLQRELLALGRSLDFVPKTAGTTKEFKSESRVRSTF